MKEDKKKQKFKITIAIILIILVVAGSFALVWNVYEDTFGGRIDPDLQLDLYLNQSDFPNIDFMEQTFLTDNGNQLSYWLYYEKGTNFKKKKVPGLIVMSHGLGNGHQPYLPEIDAFIKEGYLVFAFDNTGSAKSEGDGLKGLPQGIIDLDNALNFIVNNSYLKKFPIGLYGHSWGGYSVMNILHKDYPIKAVIERSGPVTSKSIFMSEAYKELGQFSKLLGPFVSLTEYIKFGNISTYNAIEAINGVDIPILLMHSKGDSTVPIEISPIMNKSDITNKNVKFRIFEDRGHDFLMSNKASKYQKEVLNDLSKLKEKYEEIPLEKKQEFMSSIDKLKLNEIDSDIMNEMIIFLNSVFY